VSATLAQLQDRTHPTEARTIGVTLSEMWILRMLRVFDGHGVHAADFVHCLRVCVTRLFDADDEGDTVKMTWAGPDHTGRDSP
jgi:hypothetical protein